MNQKRNVLVVFPDMIVGGATTALVAFLRKIDYEKNNVDLLFLNNGTERLDELPREVNVLPDAATVDLLRPKIRLEKVLDFVVTGKCFLALYETIKAKEKPFFAFFQMATNQMLARIHCQYSSSVEKEYDLAIAYLELWPTVYVAEKVRAKKKVAWCHVDYPAARLNPMLDEKYYQQMDQIFCVSPECAEHFQVCFPQLRNRVDWTENLIDEEGIRQKADSQEELEHAFTDYAGFRIVTVERLDSYTKGLDRITSIVGRLKADGLDFRWYLIGGGPDAVQLRQSIAEKNISDRLSMLGEKRNPYPYMKQADLFVLASRNEGKPITVTEAQILNTPILVTEYPAARGQLEGSGGCIVENSEEALYQRLRSILNGKEAPEKTRYLRKGQMEQLEILQECRL